MIYFALAAIFLTQLATIYFISMLGRFVAGFSVDMRTQYDLIRVFLVKIRREVERDEAQED